MMTPTGRDLMLRFVEGLTDHAMAVLDIHGKVLAWNAGARLLFGYDADEIVGRGLSQVHTKSDYLLGKIDAALNDALQWGRHESTPDLVAKDGTQVPVRMVLRPLLDNGQRLLGFGMIATALNPLARPAAADAANGPAVRRSGSARILVVDDNQGVLEEAVEQLERLGYGVVSATSGSEALAVLARGEAVDLLFTDVVMPGEIAGRALAEKAVELRPGLKVLFASGYFEGALVSKGDLETDVEFIAKPYRMKALAEKVEEILGADR
jgi:PAS domain S-box-containing protein